jgi:hypothetical protein
MPVDRPSEGGGNIKEGSVITRGVVTARLRGGLACRRQQWRPALPSALSVHALRTVDAVIHEPGISVQILDLVKPPRYREAAAPSRTIERSIKPAQDGWCVAYLVAGNAMDRAMSAPPVLPNAA